MTFYDEDVVRCRVNSTIVGAGVSLNIFTAQLDMIVGNEVSDADMATNWTDYLDDVLAPLLAHISSLVETNSFDLYRRDALGEWSWQHNEAYSPTYTGLGSALPAGVAAVITAFTAINRVVGRKFFPPIQEQSLDSGLWGTGLVADLATAALAYVTPNATYPDLWRLVPGVWSTKMNAFVPFNLTALVTNIPSYQRRRRTGVGE